MMGRNVGKSSDLAVFEYGSDSHSHTGSRKINWIPSSLNSKVFVGASILEAVIDVTLEVLVFYWVSQVIDTNKKSGRVILTYLSIYIFAFVFQVLCAWDAVRRRNMIQIFALLVFNACFIVYSIIQIQEVLSILDGRKGAEILSDPSMPTDELRDKMMPCMIAIPAVVLVTQLVYCFMSVRLYKEFGWAIWKQLGADRTLKHQHMACQIFAVLLQFDFFFFIGFTLQLLVLNVIGTSDFEFYVTIIALPITFVCLLLALWAVRREINWIMILFDICLVGALVYFSFKLYRIYDIDTRAIYSHDQKSLTTFAAISITLVLLTFANSIVCQTNFNKGLAKRHVSQEFDQRERQYGQAVPLKMRMELD